MKRLLFILATAATILTLEGCAANIKQSSVGETRTSTTASAPSHQSRGVVAVTLTGSSDIMQNSDWPSLINDWKELLPDTAAETKTSADFIDSERAVNANQTLLVRIKVKDFRYISTAKRYLLGVMAGNAYMDLEVEYVQLPSMQVLSSKKVNTSSSAWEGIFSAVTPKQVYAVSRMVLQDAAGIKQ